MQCIPSFTDRPSCTWAGASARECFAGNSVLGVCAQVVCITDPVLATHVLRSKHVDKLRFQYSFLDPVRFFIDCLLYQ